MFYHDPVCGKKINRQKAQAKVAFDGETYYLCCPVCQRLFQTNPEQYIQKRTKAIQAAT